MPRGGKREGAGRPRGSPNRITKEVRAALKALVEDNVGEMQEWFKRQWKTDDGGKVAATLLSRLIEFAAPKLQRTDRAPDSADETTKSVDEMSDAELLAIVRCDPRSLEYVESDILPTLPKRDDRSGRKATAADFGLAEPQSPAPAALPAPAPNLLAAAAVLPIALPVEHRKREEAPAVEGELMARDVNAILTAKAEKQRRREREERMERYRADQAAWELECQEARDRIREKLGNPNWQPMSWRALEVRPPPQWPGGMVVTGELLADEAEPV